VALKKNESLKEMISKKTLAIVSAVVMFLPALSFAVGNYITLPDGMVADLLEYGSQLFTDLNLIVILAIGLPLGFWIIRKVLSLVRAR